MNPVRQQGGGQGVIIPLTYRLNIPITNELANKLATCAQDLRTDEESLIVEALALYLDCASCPASQPSDMTVAKHRK